MNEGSKNDEVSVSVRASKELSGFGLEAKAKSRAISAIDRLFGGVAGFLTIPLERKVREHQSRAEAKEVVAKAAARAVAAHVSVNPELAADFLGIEFEKAARKQENKEAVLFSTVEQLKLSPPS